MSVSKLSMSERAKLYLPLAFHLIPTLGIGYLVVIPQSCIAGTNELTIGFAAANLGFVLTYIGGITLARKHGGANA